MRIWLVTVGEPLPTDAGDNRLLRTGVLANYLGALGHEVVWWTSNFDHVKKKKRFAYDTWVHISERVEIKLLNARGYSRNISFSRMINHALIARRFAAEAPLHPKPDIVLCALPTVELSDEAVKYGLSVGVPVIVDVRDLWPDIIANILPAGLRTIGKVGLSFLFIKTARALRNATGILAVSETYLQWGLRYAGRTGGVHDEVIPIGYQGSAVSVEELAQGELSLLAKGVDPTRRICWFIGTFGRTYDLGTVIRAAREMDSDGVEDVQFVFSGGGEMYEAWVIQSAGLRNVIFTGWVDRPQIAFLSRVTAVALQAYAKGAPQALANKLFEYLSAGLPILSSLRGENQTLLDSYGCGLTYQAGDYADFRRQLDILLKNDVVAGKMRDNALQLFNSEFRMEMICDRTASYLERICDMYYTKGRQEK